LNHTHFSIKKPSTDGISLLTNSTNNSFSVNFRSTASRVYASTTRRESNGKFGLSRTGPAALLAGLQLRRRRRAEHLAAGLVAVGGAAAGVAVILPGVSGSAGVVGSLGLGYAGSLSVLGASAGLAVHLPLGALGALLAVGGRGPGAGQTSHEPTGGALAGLGAAAGVAVIGHPPGTNHAVVGAGVLDGPLAGVQTES